MLTGGLALEPRLLCGPRAHPPPKSGGGQARDAALEPRAAKQSASADSFEQQRFACSPWTAMDTVQRDSEARRRREK